MVIGMAFTGVMVVGLLITIAAKDEDKTSSVTPISQGQAVEQEPEKKTLTDEQYKALLKEYSSIEKTLSCSLDKFQKTKFCEIRGEPSISIGAYLSVAPLGADRLPGCYVRFRISYTDNDWVFFDNVTILLDNTPKEYTLRKPAKRDNSNGLVFETYDVLAEERELELLKNISTSKSAEIRLSGQRIKDFKVSTNQKKAIGNILRARELCESDKK